MKNLTFIIFSILLANLALADAALMPGKRALVIYQDGDTVFLKRCESANSFPANRNCGGEVIGSLPKASFIKELPFRVQGFETSISGLNAARAALQDAIAQNAPEQQINSLRFSVYFLELSMDILTHLNLNQDINLNQYREKHLKLVPENLKEELGRTTLKALYTELMVFFAAAETKAIVNGKEVRYLIGARDAQDAEKYCASIGPTWKTPVYRDVNNKIAFALSPKELKETIKHFDDLIIYNQIDLVRLECWLKGCEIFPKEEGRGFPGATLDPLQGINLQAFYFEKENGSVETTRVWGTKLSDIVCVKLP